jgi:hypothetical protein
VTAATNIPILENDVPDREDLALPPWRRQPRLALRADRLDAVADRGYFNSEEILACAQAGIAVTLPKPMSLTARAMA